MDMQVNLRLYYANMSEGTFSHITAHLAFYEVLVNSTMQKICLGSLIYSLQFW